MQANKAGWINWHPIAAKAHPPVSPEFTGEARRGLHGREESPLHDLRGELVAPGEEALVAATFLDGLRKRRYVDASGKRRVGEEFGKGNTRAGKRSDDAHWVAGAFHGEFTTANGVKYEVVDMTAKPKTKRK